MANANLFNADKEYAKLRFTLTLYVVVPDKLKAFVVVVPDNVPLVNDPALPNDVKPVVNPTGCHPPDDIPIELFTLVANGELVFEYARTT
jgi:hypothetical protein